MEEKKSYYAVIPANVRYDTNITNLAKLLYGEITSLCNEKGFCWATNKYFAELYSVSVTTISKSITQLKENGYIEVELIYKEGTKEILNRYLKIIKYPIKENLNTPIKENLKENNKYINNKMNNKKEYNIIGAYNNIKLTDEHIAKLKKLYGAKYEEAIETLSSYIESSGRKYKNFYAVLDEHNWVYKKIMSNNYMQNKQRNLHVVKDKKLTEQQILIRKNDFDWSI